MANRSLGDNGPGRLEWLKQKPIGAGGAGLVVAGWLVVALLYFRGVWSLEVTFFVAVGVLTFVLGCLSLYAAVIEARRPRPTAALRLPESWDDLEEYFRWLTPVAFIFGLVFAHFFLH